MFSDGIPWLQVSFTKKKAGRRLALTTPSFDEEAKATVKFVGLPPLEATPSISGGVLFRNVSNKWRRDESGVHSFFRTRGGDDEGIAFVEDGEIICVGSMGTYTSARSSAELRAQTPIST